MNGKTKSNSVVSVTLDNSRNTLTFAVLGAGEATLEVSSIDEHIMRRAALHGLKQRISDAAAMSRDTTTGLAASPAEKFEAVKALVEHYNSGSNEWSPKRSERIGSDETLLSRCLTELYPDMTAEAIRSKVTGWTKVQRAAMLKRPEVAVVADRILGETLGAVDTDSMLLELMG